MAYDDAVRTDVIFKYRLLVGEEMELKWADGHRVLRAECEHGGGAVVFWVYEPLFVTLPHVMRTFELVGTGHRFAPSWEVHATASDLDYSNAVWHLVSHE